MALQHPIAVRPTPQHSLRSRSGQALASQALTAVSQISAELGSWHRLLAGSNLSTLSSIVNPFQDLGLPASLNPCGMSAAASAPCVPAAPAAAAGRSLWRSSIAAASNDAASIYAAAHSHAAACTHPCALLLSASQKLSTAPLTQQRCRCL